LVRAVDICPLLRPLPPQAVDLLRAVQRADPYPRLRSAADEALALILSRDADLPDTPLVGGEAANDREVDC
jgi:hypothetical protein